MTKIKPVDNRILVVRQEAEERSESGRIILPDVAKRRPQQGEIVEVGPKSQFKTGDSVLFIAYAGSEIRIEKKDYILLADSDILAVLVEE